MTRSYDMFDTYAADLARWEARYHEDDCPKCRNESLDDDGICTLPECGADSNTHHADEIDRRIELADDAS
jgi:hypothetical protein